MYARTPDPSTLLKQPFKGEARKLIDKAQNFKQVKADLFVSFRTLGEARSFMRAVYDGADPAIQQLESIRVFVATRLLYTIPTVLIPAYQ